MILIMTLVLLAAALAVGLIACKSCGKKRLQKEKAEPDIFLMILPSMMGIGACCLCLIGGTYAWFTANVTTPAQTIRAANYDIDVSIQCGAETIDPDSATDVYTYTLSPQTHDSGSSAGYTVTLTATGTASTGYCKITRRASGSADVDAAQSEAVLHVEESSAIDAAPSDAQTDIVAADGTAVDAGQTDTVAADGTVFYTVQINNLEKQPNSITFTIFPTTENEQYTFEAVWGTYSGTEGRISDKDVIGTPPSETEGQAGLTETQSETEGQSDATETQFETEGRSDATETQSETRE